MKKIMTFASIVLLSISAVAQGGEIKNWSAPATWTPPAERTALVATTYPPLPFIPVTPCRVVDTRAGSGFASGYGPPSLVAGAQRSFTITGQCGIPAGAQAVSFNFAVWAPTTRGDLRVFPTGGGTPTVSTLNWEAGILALANAAVAPLGSGAITVQLDSTTPVDIFVDVNGYYSSSPASSNNTFVINGGTSNGGVFTTTGGGEALIGNCLTASNNCYAVYGTAQTGDYTGYFSGGKGVFSLSTDTGYSAFTGLATNDSGATLTTTLTTGDNAGVEGHDGNGVAWTSGTTLNGTAGVYGWGRSGVAGVTSSTGNWGVVGLQLTSPTALGAFGMLGYGAYGVYANGNFGATGTKSFVEPHPTDASKVIRYVSLEGNESGTYFRGTAQIINGEAVIQVPEDFGIVTDVAGLTVQVTPVGGPAVVWVASEGLDQIVLQSRTDVKVHYLVQGVRKAYRDFQAIASGQEFRPLSAASTIPAHLSAEAKRRLIQNGTYNPDGTVNMSTAERVGWAEAWREQAKAAAAQPAVVPGKKQ